MKLKEYLRIKGLSGLAFAKKHSLSQPTISRIINNKVVPSPEIALKIEQATNGEVTRLELLYPSLNNEPKEPDKQTASYPDSENIHRANPK